MKPNHTIRILAMSLWISGRCAMAQDDGHFSQPEILPSGHGPPPQAYTDCRGKQTGDAVQHMTPEGLVAATCQNSPEGLVARPNNRSRQPAGKNQ
ncbi:exported hypothetical protein [Gammaproteobacteria bacterium]